MKKLITSLLICLSTLTLTDCKTIKSVILLGTVDFKEKHFHKEIPFVRKDELIQVKVGINGSDDKYDFVFDTGAGGSVISKKLADSLKLKKVGEIDVLDALGNKTKNIVVSIKELDINGLKFYGLAAVVADFGKNSPINCIGKDGIIGVNIIAACNWTVDYQAKKLIATDSALNILNPVATIPFTGGQPHFNVNIGHNEFKHVMFDLGSNEELTLNTRDIKKYPGMKISNQTFRKIDGSSQGLSGPKMDTVMVYYSDSVSVSGVPFHHVNVTTSKNFITKIGAGMWNKYLVGLDYKSRKIIIGLKQDTAQRQFLTGFGMRVSPKDGKYVITALFDNSPAYDAGIKIGDEVEEIDGKPIALLFNDFCYSFFYQAYILDKQSELKVKLARSHDVILLKRSQYRPVN